MKRKGLKSHKSGTVGDMTIGQDDMGNVLLDENTVNYNLFDEDGDDKSSKESATEGISFVFEVGHTRRYHRCFKLNIILNIGMMLTFMGLIMFGPWYYMEKVTETGASLTATFSLIILKFDFADSSGV